MPLNIQFDFGLAQTNVGYQFYNDQGVLLANRITTGIAHGPAAGLYIAEADPPADFVGVYWDCDDPNFNGFEQLVPNDLTIPFAPITVDFTGASPQFVTDPVGPFVYLEPNVGGGRDIITVAVQGGIFSGLNLSGVTAAVQTFAPNDLSFQTPIRTVKAVIVNKIGNSTFRIEGGSLASGQAVVGTRFSGNLTQIGLADVEIDNFGHLALILDDLLCAFRRIQRFEEQGRISEDGTKAIWGWGNWHLSPDPVITRNSNTWVSRTSSLNNYAIDYKTGSIFFTNYLAPGEDIRCTYEFRMLDLSIYKNFFQIALDIINLQKPQTSFDQNTFPGSYSGALLLYAYVQACRVLIPKMSTFRFRRLFENATELITSLQNNMATAQTQWDQILTKIKRRGLVAPAAVSTYVVGREVPFIFDGTSVMDQLVITRL